MLAVLLICGGALLDCFSQAVESRALAKLGSRTVSVAAYKQLLRRVALRLPKALLLLFAETEAARTACAFASSSTHVTAEGCGGLSCGVHEEAHRSHCRLQRRSHQHGLKSR